MASGTPTRVRLPPAARRTQLVELGLELLADRPLDQLPVDEIADAAGISRSLLFHYFPTKRDYLLAVVEAATAQLVAEVDPDRSLTPADQLHEGVDAFVRFVEAKGQAYVSLVRGAAGADERLVAVFESTRDAIVERILDTLGESRPPALVRLAVRGWVAMVEEVTADWVRSHRRVPREHLLTLFEATLPDLVLRAMAPG